MFGFIKHEPNSWGEPRRCQNEGFEEYVEISLISFFKFLNVINGFTGHEKNPSQVKS